MKTNAKRILLVVLLIVLVYVWWGNLHSLTDTEVATEEPTGEMVSLQSIIGSQNEIRYMAPKINPFAVWEKEAAPTHSVPAPKPSQTPAKRLSTNLSLQGVLNRGDDSQAVLVVGNFETRVLQINDSIQGWSVVCIEVDFVVCKLEDDVDTLWLQKPGLERP